MVTVEEPLPLPDHAEDGVVHNDNLHIDVVVRHRRKFLAVHHDAAVARDEDNLLVGVRELRADRGGQPVAHRAETARGEEVARRMAAEELCRPHLMLPHIRNADRILRNELTHTTDELLGADVLRCLPAKRMGTLHREHLTAPRAEAHRELLHTAVLHHIEKCGQRLAQIADNGNIRTDILVQFGRINVKMHNLRL